MLEELTSQKALQDENKKLRAENNRLTRELTYERSINRRNRISAEARDNLSRIISAEKDRLEKYMNLLLTNCPDIVMFFDQEGNIALASDSYLQSRKIQAFGIIEGKSYRELLASDVDEEFLGRVDDMFKFRKRSLDTECDIDFGRDGIWRHYYIQAIPMIEESGITEGAMFLFYDTTEISRSKLEAERARELAEHSDRAKSEFLSRMSHEIRTPMNAILGMTELLLRKEIPPNAREDALGIKHAGGNLLAIINDILDFSKIESGKMNIIPGEYALTSLINDVISIIYMKLTEKPVLLVVNADASLPAKLTGDELRIRQVLLNLLSNATKYTHTGHISLAVDSVPNESNLVCLRFTVSDTGIGIKEEDMEKLFIDFSKVDVSKNRMIEGTGLGLSIARNLCRLMGGEITVESDYGRGSVFTAVIPQKAADSSPLASVTDGPRKKVLLYEKRRICADSVVRSLDNLGVPCKAVEDPAEFREEYAKGDYRFVFLAFPVYEEVKEYVRNSSLFSSKTSSKTSSESAPTVVVLTNMDNPPDWEKSRILPVPPYSVSIANVLNGEEGKPAYHESGGGDVGFIAPTARILVVDDIPTNLKVVAGLLSPYKMQVDCCCSGAEAIHLAQENRYDLALIDHMMPEMDGIETAAVIRKLPGARLPLVAFTANAMVGMREMFLKKGFNDYLTKPIEIRKLHEIVDTWIPREKRQQRVGGEVAQPSLLEGYCVEGIDLAAGKERFCDENAYLQVLHSYCLHTPVLLEKLKNVSEENLKDYSVTVHGIKGASYGIFAMTVGKEAEVLEHAASSGDLEIVKTKTHAFVENVERLLSDLNALLSSLKTEESDKPVKPRPDDALLEKLLSASKKFMLSEMENVMTELESYAYRQDADLISWLREQVDNLEYETIQKRLEKKG
ncbi:MAG: response regulator [Synergistaceae bacterium]|nr:response regulator [Synergistaceae bacterium]